MSVSTGQFAGCVRVPLLLTLGRDKDQEWLLPLERKAGWQMVRGHVALSFEWSVTNEGMLMREVAALEYILAEKVELLALLNPLPSTETAVFVRMPGSMQPVPSAAIVRAGSTDGTRPLNLAAGGAEVDGAVPTLSVNRTTRAMAESYYVNLDVSVLEVTGLLPREGFRAGIASTLYGRQNANMVSTAMLPNVRVVMTCAGETREAAAGVNSVHPRFPKNTNTFQNVPLGSRVNVQVVDQLGRSYTKLLAEAEMHVSDVPGTDPLYAWLALPRKKRSSRSQRMLALIMMMEEEGDTDIMLLVRIKIHKPQVHGVMMAVTLDLAGAGLCAKTNLEELFNFTLQKIRTSLVQTRTDLQVTAAVQTIQLDNQMLEANNPVVLSPADGSQSGSVAHARRRHKARLLQSAETPNPILRLTTNDTTLQEPLLTFQVIYNQASSNQALVNPDGQRKTADGSAGILSFKKIVLELGPLDFSADQEFIEAIIAYLNAMPLADVYQDEAWQKKIDAMQGGGITAAAGADDAAADHHLVHRDKSAEEALAWLLQKEAAELELLRGQSSMWFYLEEFYLSDIFINVTLALSSSFNAGGGGGGGGGNAAMARETERQRNMLRGFLSRMSGSSGFQLINVTNAPIQLEYVGFQNRLVNRVSLINTLWRHYSWIAIAQARKVLGGAGPAIAAIPASIIWASLALVDLGQDVAAKRVGPLQVPARIGYVMCTLSGQIIGVFSRTMCTFMGLLPPRFSVDTAQLSDSEAARRFTVKPQTVVDAAYLGQRDIVMGLLAGAFGYVHDVSAGTRWQGGMAPVGVTVGLLKATLGLAMRPAAGCIEATSKFMQGIGLLCLGKRGIQGKLVRRVQAPGVAITDVVQAARQSVAHEAYQSALIAAWQVALPAISSALAEDTVIDVVAARPTRVVLLTNTHLAYIYARRHAAFGAGTSSSRTDTGGLSVTYRVKWILRNDHIDNIRGLERGYTISVEYHQPVKLGKLSLKLPLRKGMRASTAEGHKNLIFRLNRHIGHSSGGARNFGSLAAGTTASAGAPMDLQDLSIMAPMPLIEEVPGVGAPRAGGPGSAAARQVPLGLGSVSGLSRGGAAGGLRPGRGLDSPVPSMPRMN